MFDLAYCEWIPLGLTKAAGCHRMETVGVTIDGRRGCEHGLLLLLIVGERHIAKVGCPAVRDHGLSGDSLEWISDNWLGNFERIRTV